LPPGLVDNSHVPTVLLVRHGQASFGAADYDVLSEAGRRQAKILAASLAERGYRPAHLVSGTLRRQRETAAAFAARGAPELEVEPRWDEFDSDDVLTHHSKSALRLQAEGTGDAAGETLTNRGFQAALEPALAEWVAHAERSPTAQTWPEFSGAGSAALADLTARLTAGQTAVVVTSGGAIAAVVGALLGAPAEVFAALNRVLVNASVTKLAIGASGTNVVSFNDHSHLESVDRALVTYR
jgi:broad specificity phosphatase PhoE